MVKGYYEFADITAIKQREEELRIREEREAKKRFKVCSKCGIRKSPFSFSVERRRVNGRIGVCKVCRSKESLGYYYRNRERILIWHRSYQEKHKETRAIYFRLYYEENKEHLQEIARKWYKKNKKRIKESALKYYKANKEACNQRRKLWIENNREKIRTYNREYKRKRS